VSDRWHWLLMIVFGGALVYGSWRPRPRLPFRPPWWVPPESWDRPLQLIGVLFGIVMIVAGLGLFLGWLPV